MASTAIRIASVAYDAALRRFEAAVDYFAPGLPQPLRVPVTIRAPESISHPVLVRHLVRRANRQIGR